jgi:hypothetical protein
MSRNISVWLSETELVFLHNSVGEAWEAARINEKEFKARTGETYARAREVRAKLKVLLLEFDQQPSPINGETPDMRKINVTMSVNEVRLLWRVAEVTLAAIEPWELQTRTAATPEEATTVLNRLRATLGDAEKQ